MLALENLAKANELYDLVKNHSFEQSSITIPSENLKIKRGVPIFKVSKTNVYDEDGREEMNFLRDQIVDETDVVQLNPTEQNTARAMRLDELSEEEMEEIVDDIVDERNDDEEENYEADDDFPFNPDLFTGL